MADTSVVVALIGEDRLSGPATAAARAIAGIEASAAGATSSLEKTGSVFAGVFKGGLALAAVGAGMAALKTGIDAVGEAAIGGNARMEQLQAGFTSLLKSGADAEAFLFQLQQFAAATPFSFEDVATGARNLLAMGFAAKDVIPLMTDLGNVVAGLGGTSADVQRLARVLGQMQTTGKVLQGDLLQLASAGVNLGRVYEIMAQQTGKSTAELHKMQEQGKLATDVFIRAFRTMSQTDFGTGMADQTRTFTGAMSTISDSLQFAAQFAFKPFFERLSDVAQRVAAFVQTEQFMDWAVSIAAAVDVALDGLGTLASGFATGLGAVLDITLSLGQMIYEALQWLNPFASHSQPLVFAVEDGVAAMVAAYGELGRAVPPINATKDGVQALKEEMDRSKEEAKAYADAVKTAERAITDLGRSALVGEGALSDQAFAIDQNIARVQLTLNKLRLSNAPKSQIDAMEKSLERLRLQADNVRLQDKIQFDPQHRRIEQMVNPRDEKTFAEVASGIAKNKLALKDLRPAADQAQQRVDALADVLKASEDGLRKIEAAGKGAAGAVGGIGGAAGGAKGALDGFKETLTASREQLDAFKAKFDAARASFQQTFTTGGVAQALAGIKAALDGTATSLATVSLILKTGGIPEIIATIGQIAGEQFPKTALAIENTHFSFTQFLEDVEAISKAYEDFSRMFGRKSLENEQSLKGFQNVMDTVAAASVGNWRIMGLAWEKTSEAIRISLPVLGLEIDRAVKDWSKTIGEFPDEAGKAVREFVRQFKAGWAGFGEAVSAILRGELSSIRIDAGPFHLGPDGFTVDPPTLKNPFENVKTPFDARPVAPTPGGGPGAPPQFQHGGLFRVGGGGGPDSQLVSFHATPGEIVAVAPQRTASWGGGGGGGGHVTINLGGVHVHDQADEERLVARLRDEVESYLTGGLRAARHAGVRFPLGVSAGGG